MRASLQSAIGSALAAALGAGATQLSGRSEAPAVGMASMGAVAVAALAGWMAGRARERAVERLVQTTRAFASGQPMGGAEDASDGASTTGELEPLERALGETVAVLARLKRRLAVTERIAARREIARQVAHEIKNPLAPIRASVETLRRLRARGDDRFDEVFEEATRTVLEEVARITRIVGDFTELQRMPAPVLEEIDLVETARGVVSLHAFDPLAVRTGAPETPRVELVVETEGSLRGDRDQLARALTNLVQNGLESASSVRDDPRVLVTIGALDAATIRLVVRDNGPGVAEEMIGRLFEPYATSKPSGTGLGLAIVQRTVFEHGGEIHYRPATKGGAVFEITLPRSGPSPLEATLEPTGPIASGSPPRTARRT